MTRFQNNFTEKFLGWSFKKNAKIVLLHRIKWTLELKMKQSSPPRLMAQFQNYFTKMFLLCTFIPKLLKWFRSAEQKAARAKNRKTFKHHLFLGQWHVFKIIPLGPLYQNWFNGSAPLNKMVTIAKNRKTFKHHLLISQFKHHLLISRFQNYFTEMFLLRPFRA